MNILLILLLLFVIVVLFLLLIINSKGAETIAIVQQPNLPNFIGKENELKSENYLIFETVRNSGELRNVVKSLISKKVDKIILNVTSELLTDLEDLLLKTEIPIVAGMSTVIETRSELPNLYYLLTDDVTIVNKALFGYLPEQNTTPSVFLSAGTDLYIQRAKDIAISKGVTVFDLTSHTPLSPAELDQLRAAQAIFVSALNSDQEFVVSQIPADFNRLILFVNLPPSGNFVYPPNSEVRTIGPSSFFRASRSNPFVEAITDGGDVNFITLAMMPILVNVDWKTLYDNTMMFKGVGGKRDSTFTDWPSGVSWSANTL